MNSSKFGSSLQTSVASSEMDAPLSERDIRLDDWLNDKIQTIADLSNIKELLKGVDDQKALLEQQLLDAQAKLAATKQDSADHALRMLEQTSKFEQQYDSIQDHLMAITSSDSPEEAMEILKGPLEKLRRVDLASLYIELLKEVDELSVEARKYLPAEPKEALKPYTRLKELAITIQQLQDPAEGAAVHLVKYVDDTTGSLWLQMKKIMSDEFDAVLKKTDWPSDAREPTREWIDCFEKLLDLQTPEIIAARNPLVLLPFEVLCKPFIQQFRYHFFSDKPTNDPSRLGDYFFGHFINTVTTWEPYLRDNIAPVMAAHFRGNILAGNTLYVDPVSAFIVALLPVVWQKVENVISGIGKEPKLLSKFMRQLLNFDDSIRDTFDYNGGNLELGWKGLTWDVSEDYIDRWINGEKEFALQRYREIIKSPDTGLIDYDNEISGKTRPTYGAVRVADLIDNVTQSYSKVRKFSQKMRFLIEIQAEILDQYQGRLTESLDAYSTITNPVARKLHGISKEQQAELDGVRGIESLCKVYGSANYIIDILRDWSDSEFFIHLWGQLQARAKRTNVHDNLAGSMSYSEVKDSTSTAVGSESVGSVFDVTISGYGRLRTRAEDLMIGAIKSNISTSMRHYFTRAQWTSVAEIPSVLNVTAELDQPLQAMRDSIGFLLKALSAKQSRRLIRQMMAYLQDLMWSELLTKQDFTAFGAARLSHDLIAFERLSPDGGIDLHKLGQGIILLNLPVDLDIPFPGRKPSDVSLLDASTAFYSTNATADQMLTRLHLDQLSRADARTILGRRVEAQD